MTFDEIKASLPEHCKFFYNGLTQEEAFSLPYNIYTGQYKGIWYVGSEFEIQELIEKRIGE